MIHVMLKQNHGGQKKEILIAVMDQHIFLQNHHILLQILIPLIKPNQMILQILVPWFKPCQM